jgi:hypothetical protein
MRSALVLVLVLVCDGLCCAVMCCGAVLWCQLRPVRDPDREWGLFSLHVPGRTGAQCRALFDALTAANGPFEPKAKGGGGAWAALMAEAEEQLLNDRTARPFPPQPTPLPLPMSMATAGTYATGAAAAGSTAAPRALASGSAVADVDAAPVTPSVAVTPERYGAVLPAPSPLSALICVPTASSLTRSTATPVAHAVCCVLCAVQALDAESARGRQRQRQREQQRREQRVAWCGRARFRAGSALATSRAAASRTAPARGERGLRVRTEVRSRQRGRHQRQCQCQC